MTEAERPEIRVGSGSIPDLLEDGAEPVDRTVKIQSNETMIIDNNSLELRP